MRINKFQCEFANMRIIRVGNVNIYTNDANYILWCLHIFMDLSCIILFMEPTYFTQAIILTRRPFRENDVVVTVYSADKGKLELAGRGVKKISSKLAAHLEPITLSNIMVVRGRQLDYVGAAGSLTCFARLKNNFGKIAVAGRAASVFNQITKPGQADYQAFALLLGFLRFLDQAGEKENYDLFFYFFLFKFLAVLGHKPELFYCLACRQKIKMVSRFSLAKGGLVCPFCPSLKGLTISADCIKVLRLILAHDFNFLAKIKVNYKFAISQEPSGCFLMVNLTGTL